MKKTDFVTKLAALLVFAALAVYLGVYFARSVRAPVVTAPAVQTTLRSEVQLSGIIVRDETLLTSAAKYMSLSAEEGKRVGKSSAVAVTYASGEAAQRAEQIREKEAEIARTESLLSGLVSAEEVTARDSTIRQAVSDLAAAAARHSVSEAEDSSLTLKSLLLTGNAETVTAGDLILMRSELEKLRANAQEETEPVLSPAAGIFSTQLDGFEHLRPETLQSLTPDDLREMMDDQKSAPKTAFGKIVGSVKWYFASLISAEDYAQVQDALTRGSSVKLQLGRYYPEPLTVRVEDVGREEDGSRVVVFSCSRAMADTLSVRTLSATLIASEHSGIRVPAEALHTETDENGETLCYVFVRTGVQAEKKYIDVVWETEDYVLAVPGARGSMLRDGNEIIVSARELYDGKVME